MGGSSSLSYGGNLKDAEETKGESKVIYNKWSLERGGKLIESPHEGVDNLLDAFRRTASRIPDEDFLGTREKDGERKYKWRSFSSVEFICSSLAKAIMHHDLVPEVEGDGKKFKFMGIYGKNKEEWLMAHLANFYVGATTVALYDTLGEEALEFAMNQTQLACVACQANLISKLCSMVSSGKTTYLKSIISFEDVPEADLQKAEEAGIKVYLLRNLVQLGKEMPERPFNKPNPDDVFMFCYTSGTTGVPKAAMVTHRMALSVVAGLQQQEVDLDEKDTIISYLPYAHCFEQAMLCYSLCTGIKIGYFSGDVLKLMDDLQALKPTLFPSVPRLFNRIYDGIKKRVADSGGAKRKLFDMAVNAKLYHLQNSGSLTHKVYDKLVFNKIKQMIGGRVRMMVTGSAPISPDVLNFLKVCFCAPLLEGYGQTETFAASSITSMQDKEAGHCGGIIPSLMCKLVDVPEMEYSATDDPPRGEICFKGNSLFPGYYMAPDKNKEAIDEDGWLHSGDVGMLLPNFGIKLIDRKKNIFKLSQGEYIAPEKLENAFVKSAFVDQIFVYGDSLQNFLVGIVVPDRGQVKKAMDEKGTSIGEEEVCGSPEAAKLIIADLDRIAKESKFSGLEKVKKLFLSDTAFTIENDLLTPSMKLKRNIAKNFFQEQLDQLYAS